jgi:hypothetical protein
MSTAAWTAFEVLAEDLWVRTVNLRPRLAIVALDAEADPGDGPNELDLKKKKEFRFNAQNIREYNYDLSSHVGDPMRGKWEFSRRDKSLEAYTKVFSRVTSMRGRRSQPAGAFRGPKLLVS